MSVNWSANYIAPSLDPASYADPNSSAPAASYKFETPDRYSPEPTALVLVACGGSTATVTTEVWIYDGASATWLLWDAATAIAVGAPRKLFVPPYAIMYVRVTARANSPTKLVAGFMPYSG